MKQKKLQQFYNKQTPEEKTIQLQRDQEYKERLKQRKDVHNKKLKYLEILPKKPAEKAIRIRIYPTPEQKKTLKKWFGVKRWVYNKCLNMYKGGNKLDLKTYRKLIINNDSFLENNKWMLEYEYDLRDEALRDFFKNVKTNIEKGKKFEIKYKSKRNKGHESLSVLSKKWNKSKNFYSSVFKPSLLKSSETLPINLEYTSRLIYTNINQYFLCIPKSLELQSENQAHKSIFIDPGQVDMIHLELL